MVRLLLSRSAQALGKKNFAYIGTQNCLNYLKMSTRILSSNSDLRKFLHKLLRRLHVSKFFIHTEEMCNQCIIDKPMHCHLGLGSIATKQDAVFNIITSIQDISLLKLQVTLQYVNVTI